MCESNWRPDPTLDPREVFPWEGGGAGEMKCCGLQLGEGGGLMFSMERSREAGQLWRESARVGVDARNLGPTWSPGCPAGSQEGPVSSQALPGPGPVLKTDAHCPHCRVGTLCI